jgi:lipopolysaccharide transport system permease protein
MAPILLAFRDVLFFGKFPDFIAVGMSFIIATLILVFGYNLFLSLQENFAEEI